ncbi:MAG: tripartite tricarboxylate transporter substrate binding protein [Noviherbaspirillum sp.]
MPYSPGGTTDLLARAIGRHLSDVWKQPVIVENKPGVNGMLGADMVAKAPPDGYTLGIASPGSHAANAGLYPKITYDTIKDFTPVTLAVSAPLLLVAHPSMNVKNVKELIALAKSKPGSISYASGGSGSSQHLAMELFNSTAGVQMTHVPYKGSAASYIDLIGGQVTLEFDVLPTAMPHIKSGKLLPLAVASSTRVPQLPDVPTVAQSGLPGFESSSWYGFVAPANLPKDILAKLNGEIVRALKKPEMTETLTKAGVIVVASTPEEFATHIKNEVAKAGKIIRDANIKAD